jgi:hypothetical protein
MLCRDRRQGGSGTATMPTLQVGAMLTFAIGIIHTIVVVLTKKCMNVQLTASSEHVCVDLVPLRRAGAQPSGPRQRLSSGRYSGRNAQCAAHPPSKHFRIPVTSHITSPPHFHPVISISFTTPNLFPASPKPQRRPRIADFKAAGQSISLTPQF